MRRFTFRYTNKVDGKGRVSIPASFRAVLEAQGGSTVYLTWNRDEGTIEGFGEAYMQDVEDRIDALPINSSERRALENRYFGNTMSLAIDGDGRIILPPDLRAQAGIEGQALFVGLGKRFHVWEPKAFEAFNAAQEEVAAGLTLERPRNGGGAA
jgi:MraZ protein